MRGLEGSICGEAKQIVHLKNSAERATRCCTYLDTRACRWEQKQMVKLPTDLLKMQSNSDEVFSQCSFGLCCGREDVVKATVLVWTGAKETQYGDKKKGDSCLPGTQS